MTDTAGIPMLEDSHGTFSFVARHKSEDLLWILVAFLGFFPSFEAGWFGWWKDTLKTASNCLCRQLYESVINRLLDERK